MKVSELTEAQRDYLKWKRHVLQKKKRENNPDLFDSFESAKVGAKNLLQDFSESPEDSVVTIFKMGKKFMIDAISNKTEFELHRSEYNPEDVVALVFFRDEEPFVKKMKSKIT